MVAGVKAFVRFAVATGAGWIVLKPVIAGVTDAALLGPAFAALAVVLIGNLIVSAVPD
jgi:hypothetical protein